MSILRNEIVLAADKRIQDIPIQECNEPLIDLKDQTAISYGPVPECDWTKNDYTKMRQTVYNKLISIQRCLPNQWKIRLSITAEKNVGFFIAFAFLSSCPETKIDIIMEPLNINKAIPVNCL